MGSEQIIIGGGTAGLVAVLIWIARELWADHKRRDAKTEAERDEAIDLVKTVVEPIGKLAEGQASQTKAIERLASRRRAYDGAGDEPSSDKA